jgi:hypothetical protein
LAASVMAQDTLPCAQFGGVVFPFRCHRTDNFHQFTRLTSVVH